MKFSSIAVSALLFTSGLCPVLRPKSCFCNSATSALSSWTSCVSDLICFACCRFIFSSSSTLLRRTCSL